MSGLLQVDPSVIRDNKQVFRLFCHEALRVFHDRLISLEDKNSFYVILSDVASRYFGEVCLVTSQLVTIWLSSNALLLINIVSVLYVEPG